MTAKKLLALITTLVIIFSFVGCDNEQPQQPNISIQSSVITSTTTTEAEKTTFTTTSSNNSPQQQEQHKIKNLILIIGDGMGPEHIAAGQFAVGEAQAFTSWHHTEVNTDSVNSIGQVGVLTDSAASATALATGTLTVNGYLGKDHTQKDLKTILDIAKEKGKATGIVTTDNLYGATPSGFSAHTASRNDYAAITVSQAKSDVDFLCGNRDDNHYLSRKTIIENGGYYFSTSPAGLNSTLLEKEKLYLTLDIENSASQSVTLAKMASSAIKFLERDEDGFVLIIEQAHIDKYAHSNDINGVVKSMKSLFDTVDAVMDWVGDRNDTAVMVTADHETGGLTVSAKKALTAKYSSGKIPFYYNFSTGDHTDSKVKLFTYGIEPLFSTYEYYKTSFLIKNTDIFLIMEQALNEELFYS